MTLMGNEPEIGLGDSGEHVTALQDRLRGLGLLTKQPDGSFDDTTESAVRELQCNLGLDNDGRVSTDTWQALDQHMLSNGLQYNHYAGPGNQEWDQGQGSEASWDDSRASDGTIGSLSPDGLWKWNGHDWEAADDELASGIHTTEMAIGSLSPDGLWKWNGHDWEAANGAAPAPVDAQETPMIPHIDNIHPAIAGDERFSSFHDFLRENAPAE